MRERGAGEGRRHEREEELGRERGGRDGGRKLGMGGA